MTFLFLNPPLISELEHLFDVVLRDASWQVSHDEAELPLHDQSTITKNLIYLEYFYLGNTVLLQLIFLSPEVCRERIRPTEHLKYTLEHFLMRNYKNN